MNKNQSADLQEHFADNRYSYLTLVILPPTPSAIQGQIDLAEGYSSSTTSEPAPTTVPTFAESLVLSLVQLQE